MLIVADENIPLLDEFFGDMGVIRRCPGRTLSAQDVAGADLLLVRSVTRVGAGLLAGSRPRFVGSATIGTDHVDLAWLAGEGIPFSAAPGCNARAVAEYVATVLAIYIEGARPPWRGAGCLGVVGCGNVGREVVAMGLAFGMSVVVSDPLLPATRLPAGARAVELDELLAVADVVTLHVPLTTSGPAPTRHLLDADRLAGLGNRLLINTSRGPVVDNKALRTLLVDQACGPVVLDVWEDEPRVPGDLLRLVWLGTPHVAGYSCEGKWRGTARIYDAACQALGVRPERSLAGVLAARGDRIEDISWPGSLTALLAGLCPVTADTGLLRGAVAGDGRVPANLFDALRRDYPDRREFAHFRVRGAAGQSLEPEQAAETKTPQDAAAFLARLGFGLPD